MASRITRDDIEAQLRALQGDVEDEVDARRNTFVTTAAVVAVVVVVAVFLLGRRTGKKKSTIVEIRRL
jgi:signal transduction histidine kinase